MAFFSSTLKTRMPDPSQALEGRDVPMAVPAQHVVNGRPLVGPFPDGLDVQPGQRLMLEIIYSVQAVSVQLLGVSGASKNPYMPRG